MQIAPFHRRRPLPDGRHRSCTTGPRHRGQAGGAALPHRPHVRGQRGRGPARGRGHREHAGGTRPALHLHPQGGPGGGERAAERQLRGRRHPVQHHAQDTIYVVDAIAGGPSERLGIRAGDRILTHRWRERRRCGLQEQRCDEAPAREEGHQGEGGHRSQG